MKRLVLGVTIFAAVIVLAGCPIYSSSGNYRVCDANGCWDCPDRTYSDACIAWNCASDSDCGAGYSCNAAGTCVLPSSPGSGFDSGVVGATRCLGPNDCGQGSVCGRDQYCHQGDCASWGCPGGYTCLVSFGYASCTVGIPTHDGGGATFDGGDSSVAFDATPSDAASFDSSATDGSSSEASADASDANVTVPCNADLDCGGAGARCVNGACAARSSLCSDTTQCPGGELCVAGLCTPQCSAGGSCPVGFDCDLTNNRNVCSLGGCSTTNDCFNGGVCVEGHCAQRCAAGDASSCPAGELCVNGGCIPDQHATFTCTNNGNSGSLANSCTNDAICLHHDCYTACGPADAADAADGCQADQVCTVVQTPEGTSFHVCGTGSNLGSACDPAALNAPRCAEGQVCIDGYCR